MDETDGIDPNYKDGVIVKTTPVIRDLSLNPSCDHGPTILFERNGMRYFTCSAYRSRKLCPFHMSEEKWEQLGKNSKYADDTIGRKLEQQLMSRASGSGESKKIKRDAKICHPLSLPNQQDKGEAQYHFNDTTVEFFINRFKDLEIDSILCVGTPSLHQYISERKLAFKSFLLDIDKRFVNLYKKGFTLYNMCNHHFFQDNSSYLEFLKTSQKLAIILDPPFGVKVELIWHGCIQGVQKDLAQVQKFKNPANSDLNLDVMWIFPYFMEGHILKCSDSKLAMSDFHIEYRNHAKYKSKGTSSKSSPIRIFTTIPLSKISLPTKDYRYCDLCTKWVDNRNMHCDLCGTCTTKDGGGTYIHCKKCNRCVKPTWNHCFKCKTCHLANSECKNTCQHKNIGKVNTKYVPSNSKRSNVHLRFEYCNHKKRNKK